jgi:hypothetical protein
MAIPAPPTPEEQLASDLAQIDAAFAAQMVDLIAATEESAAAISTAGSEYDDQIAAAQATLAPAIATFNAHSTTAKAQQVAAAGAAAAVIPVDVSGLIDAIPDISPVSIPDAEPVTIQAAFDSVIADFNGCIAAIKEVLSALGDTENTANLKTACTSLANSANSIIANVMPTVTDPQAEIDEAVNLLENAR